MDGLVATLNRLVFRKGHLSPKPTETPPLAPAENAISVKGLLEMNDRIKATVIIVRIEYEFISLLYATTLNSLTNFNIQFFLVPEPGT